VHALGTSIVQIGHLTAATVAGLAHLFSPSGLAHYLHVVSNSTAASQAAKTGNRPLSIVGATQVAAQAEQTSFGAFLYFFAAINIFIGLFNLLPMLPLDGGHVAVAVYERIRSRRGRMYHADVTKLMPVAYAFLLLLGFFVLTSFYLDIAHPVVLR
jgi:membrane-associated protease RseP (regulator of RpoE activity)